VATYIIIDMYYVYVLESSSKTLYVGYSHDLRRRILEHQNKKGGRTTKIKKSWRLIYYEAYIDQKDALGREKFLKGGSGRKYLHKQLKNFLV